jgi:hypothetical protein
MAQGILLVDPNVLHKIVERVLQELLEVQMTEHLERFADRVHLMRESSHERLLERPQDQGARRPGPRDA